MKRKFLLITTVGFIFVFLGGVAHADTKILNTNDSKIVWSGLEWGDANVVHEGDLQLISVVNLWCDYNLNEVFWVECDGRDKNTGLKVHNYNNRLAERMYKVFRDNGVPVKRDEGGQLKTVSLETVNCWKWKNDADIVSCTIEFKLLDDQD